MEADLSTQRWIDRLKLPALPHNVLRLQAVLARPDAGIEDAAAVIAEDPSLSARVLRVANSAQFGQTKPLLSVQRAATVLGLRSLYRIALRVEIVNAFSTLLDVPGFDPRNVWRHAILTAHAASDLAEHVGVHFGELSQEDYYSCGLLHDIGHIVMYDNLGLDYVQVYASAGSEEELLRAEEAHYQGLNHADLGSLVAAMWDLPPPLPELIRFHHEPGLAPRAQGPLRIVVAADDIANCVARHPDEEVASLVARLSDRIAIVDQSALTAVVKTACEQWKTIQV